MNTLAKRIEEERIKKGMTQEMLAEKAGVSQGLIHKLESGKAKESRKISQLASALGVTSDWLSTGTGEKTAIQLLGSSLSSASTKGTIEPTYVLGGFDLWDDDTPLRDDEVALPFFREVEMAAGSGRNQVIENHGRKLRFSKATLKSKDVSVTDAACVTVSGNSMEPVIPNGTTIGIDTSKKEIVNGEIYAIDHDGDLRVKTVYRMPGGVIRLRSFNIDDWPDELYSVDDAAKIKIIGRVFWWSVLR